MARELKFRAWDKKRKLMFELEDPALDKEYGGIFMASKSLSHVDSLRDADDEDIILMQYTGLKDKNEVEIFEGDIVLRNEPHEVIYSDEDAAFLQRRRKPNGKLVCAEFFDGEIEPEVIGNIYENPELLNTEPKAA